MKRYHTMVLISIVLSLTACVREDNSDCMFSGNLILKLDLINSEGVSLLREKINSVDVFVYDTDNRLLVHKRVMKDEQNRLGDFCFTVEPGSYRVVCWGNIGAETRIVGLEDSLSFENCYLETVSDETASPLYYAPLKNPSDKTEDGGVDYGLYEVSVLPGEVTTKEMLFVRAHRTVRVYLKGYESVYETQPPRIRFNRMPVYSDFFLRTGGERKNYELMPSSVNREGHRLMVAFNAMITPFADDMLIEVVRSSDNEVVTTINLKEYVGEHRSEIEDINEFNVEIRYLVNGAVEITLPDWGNIPLEPEW